MLLDHIQNPNDVKKLDLDQLPQLAQEIRQGIIHRVSHKGGHFGPNMGIVEGTIALHYVFDSPKDKIVYDVSHQCYPHKMLTGRANGFFDDDQYMAVTGFTNPDESEHDFFKIGHTSTSISLALGLAKARDLKGEQGNVIALIGDGSLSGGEALEGLSVAGEFKGNFIIIVNDNDMSIAENHGGLYQNLKLLRETKGKAECNLFKAMGLEYLFVEDGNNLEELISAFASVKDYPRPIVVHIVTLKGKGYEYAEENKEPWHWHAPFDVQSGELKNNGSAPSYANMTAEWLLERQKVDPTLCVLTSGTPTVGGFNLARRQIMGDQFVDVGIAEETAVAMASGIATNGGNVVYPVSSTFLQRTYDQIQQDVCINKSPVTFLVLSASVYGMTDITHTGYYDLAWLSHIPELVYLAPSCQEEYQAMLNWSMDQKQYPVCIRVPGGKVVTTGVADTTDYGKLNTFKVEKGQKVAIIGVGNFYPMAQQIAQKVEEECGYKPTLINPIYLSGLDEQALNSLKADHDWVITIEDGILEGGYGEKIATFFAQDPVKVKCFGLPKEFQDRYDPNALLAQYGITVENITSFIKSL